MEITEEKIKAIPKYILQKIRRLDDKYNPPRRKVNAVSTLTLQKYRASLRK